MDGVAIVAGLVAGLDRVSTCCCACIGGICESSITLVSALHCAYGRAPIARSGVSIVTEIRAAVFSTEREAIPAHLVASLPRASGWSAIVIEALPSGLHNTAATAAIF
jgi:hypothetical protein